MTRVAKKDIQKQVDDIDINTFKKILQFNLNANDEKIMILGDNGLKGNTVSSVLSHCFKRAADDLGMDADLVLQNAKVKGDDADEKVAEKMKALPKESIIIANVSNRIGKLGSVGLSFRKFCSKQKHRFTSASSLGLIPDNNPDHIINTYDIDYKALSKKANRIKKIMDDAKELHVTTKAGTDLIYKIPGMKAVVSDGIYREPGSGGNLPGTETYIAPKKDNVEGKIVIDGSMRTRKGTKLVNTPIEMTIKKGAVLAMNDCEESRMLEETLRWAHKKAKYPWGVRRIAEFGIGLNPKAKVIGCTVVDEKALGTGHFAIGSNYWFGGSIYAIIHLDQVFHKPTVKADGKKLNI